MTSPGCLSLATNGKTDASLMRARSTPCKSARPEALGLDAATQAPPPLITPADAPTRGPRR